MFFKVFYSLKQYAPFSMLIVLVRASLISISEIGIKLVYRMVASTKALVRKSTICQMVTVHKDRKSPSTKSENDTCYNS